MLELDHLIISTTDLDTGAEEISETLGVPLEDGGKHSSFSTHSRLLSLGPTDYLEVIAVDPNGKTPRRPRWFGLDQFDGPTRLTNWVIRAKDLSNLMSMGAAGPGTPVATSRDGMRWTMVVPDDGLLGLDGIAPALMEWRGDKHPCQVLPDHGVRLSGLRLSHPDVNKNYLPDDPRVETMKGAYDMTATFDTPNGPVTI
ncbi:MAG: VOC family protein [Pseudomonadota bacterium]